MKRLIHICLLLIYIRIESIDGGSNLRTSFDVIRNLTNSFLQTIQPNTLALNISQSLIFNITDRNTVISDYNYYIDTYWKTYVGYIILIIIALLFIIIFTLVGMCMCCCRVCCHRCGAKASDVASKNMKNKRIVFNIFLFVFSTLILFGAIVAMASNFVFLEVFKVANETNDTSGNLLFNLNAVTVSLTSYLNTIGQNINFNGAIIISSTINQAITSFNSVITTFINTFTEKISFVALINATNSFIATISNLQIIAANLSTVAPQHQTMANNFITYLNTVSNNLTNTITAANCSNVPACSDVQNQIQFLVIGFNISNINYSSDSVAVNVSSSYNVTNLQISLNTLISSMTNLQNSANSTFTNFLTSLISTVNSTNLIGKLQGFVKNSIVPLSNQIASFQQSFLNIQISPSGKNISNGLLFDYVQYAFWGFCALITIILFIVLLLYIGMFFGICGAPNFEDANRCNKGTGGGFLMASTAISFIFGWLLMLITMIMFIPGGLVYTEGCRYLNTTDPNQIQIVDSYINHYTQKQPITIGPITLPNINFYQSLSLRCSNSSDFISALQLPASFLQNISSYLYMTYIDGNVNDTIASFSSFNISNLNTNDLSNNLTTATNYVQQLANMKSSAAIAELNKSVTTLPSVSNLLVLLNNLQSYFNGPGNNTAAAQNISNVLQNLDPTIAAMASMQIAYSRYKTQFDATVTALQANLDSVMNNFQAVKTQPSTAKNLAILASQAQLRTSAQVLVNTTLYSLLIGSGNCTGLAYSFSSLVNTVCVVIFGPFNNIWMGIGCFLLFIIPAIIFAVKAAGLYRISHIETESAAYNQAYMASNQFLSKDNLEMIRLGRPQRS